MKASTCVALLLWLGLTATGSAQMTGTPTPGYRQESGIVASAVPAPLREIGFDQHLDQPLPLDARFVDEYGGAVSIGQFFGAKPVVLAFVYYECPMLCTQVLTAMTSTLSTLSQDAGRDFEVVLVGIDPRETPVQAMKRRNEFLHRYNRPSAEAGWHFLTGTEPEIRRVANASGFRYVWDDATQQYAHPTGIIVVTPDGRPARYLFGVEYGPRDVRLALLEASAGKVGSVVDTILLYCYHYDPMTGRYGLYVMRSLRLAGVATVSMIGVFIVVMLRRERGPNPRLEPVPQSHRTPEPSTLEP